MKVFIIITFLAIFYFVKAQVHYVPAQIVIPAFNASTIRILQNSTINITESNNNSNNSSFNKTSSPWNKNAPNGDLIVGHIGSMDHRLFNQVYMKERRWWSRRQTIVRYPNDLPGSYGRHETISAIRAYNRLYDGLDSIAEIIAGGVGKRFVRIRLTSKWGRGFKYLVQIYGH